MLRVIYPYSDAMFYIQREPPKNDIEWNELQGKALALAEFGNLMMMPGRARDQDQWLRDAKLLAEAGAAALKFAKAKDVEGIVGLNEQLVASCTSCHMHYRPGYGRRRGAAPPRWRRRRRCRRLATVASSERRSKSPTGRTPTVPCAVSQSV